MANDLEEYRRLGRFYRELGDTELTALARQIGDLTQLAQEVLRAEISVRRLTISAEEPPHAPSQPDPPQLGRFAHLSAKDCVWEFAEAEEVQAAAEMLAAAGIESDMILPSAENLDMGAPRLAVLRGDVTEARKLLSQPIPEEFRILVRTRDQFAPPTCPKCGADDPLLESIEPVNEWRCEICGKIWRDTLPN